MSGSRAVSRRSFLATSALGLIGLGCRASVPGGRRESDADALLYVGTYTEDETAGIHLVHMNGRTGALRTIGAVDSGPNPSFLAIHPNGRVLFAVNELTEVGGRATGTVRSFTIGLDGGLTHLGEQLTEGGAPCYVSTDRTGHALLVANYVGGNVAVFPISLDGTIAPATSVRRHGGSGPNQARQAGPHAHCIVTDPSNRFALAADLGIDRVVLYRLDVGAATLTPVDGGDAVLRPGAGPRHVAFHPNLPLVYVANELDSTVTTLRFDATRATLTPIDTRSTLPAGWSGTNYPADIHVAPSGRHLYLSNRGHNSIAMYLVSDAGTLALDQVVSTGGDWPRNFSLDPSGRWLLVANQRSGDVVVLARDDATGRLTPTAERLAIPRPVCVRFRAHTGVTM